MESKITGTSDDSYSEILELPNFFFWDIRNAGTICISETYDRRSDESVAAFGAEAYGSMEFSLESSADKAGFTYVFPEPFPLADLLGASYDWFRDEISDNPPAQSPALFFTVDADGDEGTTDDRFGLKYEAIYNGVASPMPEDTWVTADLGAATNLWSHNAPDPGDRFIFNITLSDWKMEFPNASIILVGCDAGSGWDGVFKGAVDLIEIETVSSTQLFDFELVPKYLPDVTIGEKALLSSHKGQDLYESVIDTQLVALKEKFRKDAKVFYSVGNDGNREDVIRLYGTDKKSQNVKTKYYLFHAGERLNITGQILPSGMDINLGPGEVVILKGEVNLKGKAKAKIRRTNKSFDAEQELTASSTGDPAMSDTGGFEVEFYKN